VYKNLCADCFNAFELSGAKALSQTTILAVKLLQICSRMLPACFDTPPFCSYIGQCSVLVLIAEPILSKISFNEQLKTTLINQQFRTCYEPLVYDVDLIWPMFSLLTTQQLWYNQEDTFDLHARRSNTLGRNIVLSLLLQIAVDEFKVLMIL